jgi:hypothetical protein
MKNVISIVLASVLLVFFSGCPGPHDKFNPIPETNPGGEWLSAVDQNMAVNDSRGVQDPQEFPGVAIEFKLSGESGVYNVKLIWQLQDLSTAYAVERDGRRIAITRGNVWDDYGVAAGDYTYRIKSYRSENLYSQSAEIAAKTFDLSGSPLTSKNNHDSLAGIMNLATARGRPQGFLINGLYYRYTVRASGSGATARFTIYEEQSSDGIGFGQETEIYHVQKAAGSRLEGVGVHRVPNKNYVAITGHYENGSDYSLGWFYVGHVYPGQGADGAATYDDEVFCGVPPGGTVTSSRDQSIFVDDDDRAYMVCSVNTNVHLALYRLDNDWKNLSYIKLIHESGYREAPFIIKRGGRYFCFSSRAANWWPSQTQYVSATQIDGAWATAQNVGQSVNYGAQFNHIATFPADNREDCLGIYGYRWGAQWGGNNDTPPRNYPRLQALEFRGAEYVAAAWFAQFEYYNEWGLVPVQSGRYLSLNAAVQAPNQKNTGVDKDAANLVDGTDLSSGPYYKHNSYPYDIVIDLGRPCVLKEINLSTYFIGGSETIFRHVIYVSNSPFSVNIPIQDGTAAKPGFMTHRITTDTPYRYVRMQITEVRDIAHGKTVDFFNEVYELSVFGSYED